MSEAKDLLSISDFYAQKTVFITGATGFLGKVVIEKLLRACPRVKKIYLLARSRRGVSPQQRIDDLLDGMLYDTVRDMGGDWRNKLVPIKGDIAEDKLGMSDEDWKMLQENVEIVFHSAATVRFDEDLKDAMTLNLYGTQNVIGLCRGMKRLEVRSFRWMNDDMVNSLTPHLIGKRPNTYTFTKSLAEHVLLKEADNIPIAIFRPSIIGAAWKEPLEGWIDNFNGPSGLFVAAGKGMLRSMIGDLNAIADIIPVDYSANMLLAIAWHRVAKSLAICDLLSTPGHNFHTIQSFKLYLLTGTMISKHFENYPFEGVFRRPNFAFEQRKLIHYYWCYIGHKIPAFIADMGSFCSGQRPRMNKLYGKLDRATKSLIFFTSRGWEFSMDNYHGLIQDMSPQDRETFNFDVQKLDWNNYFLHFILGLKKFVLKEDMANLPVAQSRIRR
ncbi:Fatty acyl-CoA reductase 1 [Stylophora pistillata]|uniref:Fatty acyl-CoA reductase n=1 Tax=Stylophora pistillata TaxID=50429 RepID=A0A2B4RAU2_STYPI|nr:Fatty acyl-CoA reductase 1 [Stylophora pistillata]